MAANGVDLPLALNSDLSHQAVESINEVSISPNRCITALHLLQRSEPTSPAPPNSLPTMSTKFSSKLTNARILIFGGTSGLGFAVAEACLEAGAHVTISGSRQPKIDDKLTQLLSSSPDAKPRLQGFACDLAVEDAVEANIKTLLDSATQNGTHQLSHIVWTAGDLFQLKPLAEASASYIHATSLVRFIAPILLAKLLATSNPPYLTKSNQSSLTLTGGVNSHKPGPGWAVLAGLGTAVEGTVRGLAVDMAPVRVNCVAPGAVFTELLQGRVPEKVIEMYRSHSLTGQIGAPEDVAEAYLYAMRDRFVTGTVIHSNGGQLLT